MALLGHGGMGGMLSGVQEPSTLGFFLRSSRFGHFRQLDAVASRFLLAPTGLAGLFATARRAGRGDSLLHVDGTLIEVRGYAKDGAGFGYTGVRGMNALMGEAAGPTIGHSLPAPPRLSLFAAGQTPLPLGIEEEPASPTHLPWRSAPPRLDDPTGQPRVLIGDPDRRHSARGLQTQHVRTSPSG
jgi:hypothetical protein